MRLILRAPPSAGPWCLLPWMGSVLGVLRQSSQLLFWIQRYLAGAQWDMGRPEPPSLLCAGLMVPKRLVAQSCWGAKPWTIEDGLWRIWLVCVWAALWQGALQTDSTLCSACPPPCRQPLSVQCLRRSAGRCSSIHLVPLSKTLQARPAKLLLATVSPHSCITLSSFPSCTRPSHSRTSTYQLEPSNLPTTPLPTLHS